MSICDKFIFAHTSKYYMKGELSFVYYSTVLTMLSNMFY